MICIQYEQPSFSEYFYEYNPAITLRIMIEYFQYEAGVLPELSNP
jgi:hypothetical protein